MANITVDQAIARLKRQFDDSLGEISDLLYLDWLNDLNFMIYREIYNTNAEKFITESAFTVSTGTTSYSLPADFKNTNAMGCGLYDDNDNQFVKTRFGSKIKGYFIQGTNLIVTPSGSFDADVTLRYMPSITALTATTDTMVIDFEDLLAVINWLDKNYGEWNLDTIRENNADGRFVRSLTELIANTIVEQDIFILN